jgi:2-phospho-L-lactate guanylyltransferase (CobY/MobA/RfbA family)
MKCSAIAPDRSGLGTNALALALDAGARDMFHFGADSCARHRAALTGAGYRVASHVCDELAFDLDTPQDHAEWLTQRDARIPRGTTPPVQYPVEEAEK